MVPHKRRALWVAEALVNQDSSHRAVKVPVATLVCRSPLPMTKKEKVLKVKENKSEWESGFHVLKKVL